MINSPHKRLTCTACLRIQANCICAFVCPIANAVELCIVQHPSEGNKVKNTAGLLCMSLQQQQLLIGEQFNQAQLHQWLYRDNRQPLLLYPPNPPGNDSVALGLATPAPLPDLTHIAPQQLRLVVLDATWKKSRKLLYQNPELQQLPRLTLHKPPPSQYRVRKADCENQLSTLEASCYALAQLENSQAYQPLLNAFCLFVDQLAERNPAYSGLPSPHSHTEVS